VTALAAAAALLLAAPAGAAVPVALVERQVITLEFSQPVQRLAVSDPGSLALQASGGTVRVQGLKAGRVQVDVVFGDGATATFDVSVEALQRPAVRPIGPDEIELEVGQERTLPAPAGAQVLLEENGVCSALQDARGVVVRGLKPGATSLVVVNPSGARTTWKLLVR
jgi:hypothetical protein